MNPNQESYSQSHHRLEVFVELFSTSFWSNVLVTALSLLLVLGVCTPIIRRNVLQGDNVDFAQVVGSDSAMTIQQRADQLGTSHSAALLSLFLFWSIVGVMAYLLVVAIKNAIGGAVQVEDQLHYVHTKPGQLMKDVLQRTAIRSLVVVVWLLYAWVFAHLLVPYVIAAFGTAAAEFPDGSSFIYFILGFIILWASLHAHVVFARLLALRVRLFGGNLAS